MVLTTGIADDLSGAAETAAAFGDGTHVVLVGPGVTPSVGSTAPVVYDCNIRYADPTTAEARIRDVLAANTGSRLFVKIDSLLRGNIRATIQAAYATGRPTVLTPALPASGRTLVAGVPLIDGRALSDTDLWQAEPSSPPTDLSRFLAGVRHRFLTLPQLRDGALPAELAAAGRAGELLVADAETDADLDQIAGHTWGPNGDPMTILLGTRALAEAAVRATGPADIPTESDVPVVDHRSVLVLVGSADTGAHLQYERLTADPRIQKIDLAPSDLLQGSYPKVVPSAAVTAVRISPDDVVLPGRSGRLAEALAGAVAGALDCNATGTGSAVTAVVVIGGETARALLDQLEVGRLRVLAYQGDGVVRSLAAPPGRQPFHLITRPGSFGGPDSLVALVEQLTDPVPERHPHEYRLLRSDPDHRRHHG